VDIIKLLHEEEGFRSKPYICSEGYPTVGIGQRIGPKGASLSMYEFTVNERTAQAMLTDKLSSTVKGLIDKLPVYNELDQSRKTILISMAYQMGITGLLKFKNMIKALECGNYEEAGKQALDSRWAKQTPKRAFRHAAVLKNGTMKAAYKAD